ncbi:MAG: ATP-binding protein [Candidatus Acidiferrales bacterium]
MARADCPLCSGTGWRIVESGGAETAPGAGVSAQLARREAVLCDCAAAERPQHALERARIPERYLHCDFENFESDLEYEGATAEVHAWNRSLEQAKLLVKGFARDFPAGTEHGLLLMGACGVGKTHLAVAALKEIVLRGHFGLFYDYRELLKQIQNSYNPENQATELGVLEPVLKCELLLLDDVGASKPSLWALETIGHILNSRYNEKRTTLLTTNYFDSELMAAPQERSVDAIAAQAARGGARPSVVEDSLSDRIGARIRSRLYEMCRTIEIAAPDYRKEVRHAGRSRA